MFDWARNAMRWATGGTPAAKPARVVARYDNALTTPENSRHWTGADYLSARAANDANTRRRLRMRSRHETSNNPYLYGIVVGNADDLVGTGPTIQVQTDDAAFNREVERVFNEWAAEVDLVQKVRACKLARTIDGEGFLLLKTADSLDSPVKLYPVDIEADQVTAGAGAASLSELWIDGLVLDNVTERPTHYHVLGRHPGDYFLPDFGSLKATKVAAQHVVHWFPQLRPGQVRGVPVFTPSLDLFTEMRAFRRAVVRAAETAADFSIVLTQEMGLAYEGDDADGSGGADDGMKPFSKTPISRGMFTALPPGADMKQMQAAHPATTYESFSEKCIAEAVRPLAYPLNLALGTSQKFNFSSARLDHINYRSALTVERGECERVVLWKLWRAWWEEAVREGAVRAYDGLRPPPVVWHWPGFEPLDPVADANADSIRIAAGMLTWQDFWAKRGRDWRDVLVQLAAEKAAIEKLGLTFGDVVKRTVTDSLEEQEKKGEPAYAA